MIRLDSVSLRFESPINWKKDRFYENVQVNPQTGVEKKNYTAIAPSDSLPGLNNVRVVGDEGNELWSEVSFSAKALLGDYDKLVHVNTVEQLAENINSTGIIEISPESLMNGLVRTADVTNDLRLQKDQKEYIEALKSFRHNHKYRYRGYKGSVIFEGKAKRGGIRLTCYDKQKDLQKSANRKFLEAAGSGVYNKFARTVRVEQNCRSYASIRKIVATKEKGAHTLEEVLTASTKPNLTLYKKIRSTKASEGLFNEAERFESFNRFEKWKGREVIIRELGFNMALIKDFIRSRVKGYPTRTIREYEEQLLYMTMKGGLESYNSMTNRLNEIEEALSSDYSI